MNINGTQIKEVMMFYRYVYKTNLIMIKKDTISSFDSEYKPIYFTATVEKDRQKSHFKDNCKNILIHLEQLGYKGLSIENYDQLSDVAKAAILVGVESGWIEEIEPLKTYRIREIK